MDNNFGEVADPWAVAITLWALIVLAGVLVTVLLAATGLTLEVGLEAWGRVDEWLRLQADRRLADRVAREPLPPRCLVPSPDWRDHR